MRHTAIAASIAILSSLEVFSSPPASAADLFRWIGDGYKADWGGRDKAYTSTVSPKYDVQTTALCNRENVGRIAVCWEDRPNGYPVGTPTDIPTDQLPGAWCTYKDETVNRWTAPDGGAPPGWVYVCSLIVEKE